MGWRQKAAHVPFRAATLAAGLIDFKIQAKVQQIAARHVPTAPARIVACPLSAASALWQNARTVKNRARRTYGARGSGFCWCTCCGLLQFIHVRRAAGLQGLR